MEGEKKTDLCGNEDQAVPKAPPVTFALLFTDEKVVLSECYTAWCTSQDVKAVKDLALRAQQEDAKKVDEEKEGLDAATREVEQLEKHEDDIPTRRVTAGKIADLKERKAYLEILESDATAIKEKLEKAKKARNAASRAVFVKEHVRRRTKEVVRQLLRGDVHAFVFCRNKLWVAFICPDLSAGDSMRIALVERLFRETVEAPTTGEREGEWTYARHDMWNDAVEDFVNFYKGQNDTPLSVQVDSILALCGLDPGKHFKFMRIERLARLFDVLHRAEDFNVPLTKSLYDALDRCYSPYGVSRMLFQKGIVFTFFVTQSYRDRFLRNFDEGEELPGSRLPKVIDNERIFFFQDVEWDARARVYFFCRLLRKAGVKDEVFARIEMEIKDML